VDDYEPCNLQVTWSPSIPSPGQEVTVTATATDNEEMRYVAIYRGSVELSRRDATSGQDSLSVSYTEEAELPAMSYLVAAKDASPHTSQVLQSVTVPVRGTGTAPEVTVDIDWEIEEVLPERYRLIREDGQVATITCTATDPEGIDYMDIQCTGMGALHIDGGGRQTVTGEFEWVNDDPGATTFSCRLSAVDLEGNYASTDPDYIDIVRPGNLLFMTTGAPGFHNPSRDRLPWERMVQAFGVGECYWWPEEWKSPYALIWYHASFKSIASGGECFGMSTMANELYRSRIIANDVDPTVSAPSYMTYDNSFTKEYVEARQGGQMGGEVAFKRINEDFHTVSEKLNRIKADMAADTPGVLCMWEGDGGHAACRGCLVKCPTVRPGSTSTTAIARAASCPPETTASTTRSSTFITRGTIRSSSSMAQAGATSGAMARPGTTHLPTSTTRKPAATWTRRTPLPVPLIRT